MTGTTRRSNSKASRPRGVRSRGPGVFRRTTKAAGGSICEDCGIVQHGGRWSFGVPAAVALASTRCPACQRVRERYPAGTLRLPKALVANRRSMLALIRNAEEAEKAEHPFERLMAVEESEGHLIVTTTGVHLARKLAHSIGRQIHSKPRIRYVDGEDLVHVDWQPPTGNQRRPR